MSRRSIRAERLRARAPAVARSADGEGEGLAGIVAFLRQATCFSTLAPGVLQALARRMEPVRVPADAMLLRQGEVGETCYVLRRGSLEVFLHAEEGGRRRLAVLGPGALVGETALLTAAPRNASVRALEPCDLLLLQSADLLAAMRAGHGVGGEILRLLRLRERPLRRPGIEAHARTDPGGVAYTVLKDPARGAYFRLTPEGWFLWQRLDGLHTVRDLALDYLAEFKAFAPQAIADLLGGLAAAGFLEGTALSADAARAVMSMPYWQRAALTARRVLEWKVTLSGVDAMLSRLYDGGVRVLFTRPAQMALALLTLLGLAAFFLIGARANGALHTGHGGLLLLYLIPAYLLSIALHEAGHAFTVKHCGHEVPRVGVGWYWFGPIAFVDTSDMWLAGRRARLAVTAAGPYTNLVLAGLAASVANLSAVPALTAACWEFALISYVTVLINLNPLLEYDGYYLLMDWLDRPNLRRVSLAWLGRGLPCALRGQEEWRGHRLELIYGGLSLLFVAAMAAMALLAYRVLAQDAMARLLPGGVAAALAWIAAGAVVAFAVAGAAGDLRGVEAREVKARTGREERRGK